MIVSRLARIGEEAKDFGDRARQNDLFAFERMDFHKIGFIGNLGAGFPTCPAPLYSYLLNTHSLNPDRLENLSYIFADNRRKCVENQSP